jgi:hypothetical protein
MYSNNDDDDDERLRDAVASLLSPRSSIIDIGGGRRLSRASVKFFQAETSTRNLSIISAASSTATRNISTRNLVACLDGCDHGLIGSDGKVRDEYILQRQSVNRPATLNKIPLLCDLTTSSTITEVDGWVFTMLLVSGFAKISSKIDELNTINVFPIADGDTGANMKVCLKLPVRNLLLNPSDNILLAVSNMAADVLLNGQGNSGTILSHFFVSLAEEVRELKTASLTVDQFASCLARAGVKMDDAVTNPVEGTLVSVCRDACRGLEDHGPYPSLESLLATWNEIAQRELALTPDRLIVDGVKVLEKAGVVDSGAQGFVYLVEGMHLASRGLLPNALDAAMFASAKFMATDEGTNSISVDHTITDSRFRFCTECVVQLKDGIDAQTVVDDIQKAANEYDIGDSIASVKAPGKDGGTMLVKIHIHTNEPSLFFDRMQPYSRDPIFKKEKVEDMLVMRELMHGDRVTDLGDAKFTIMGLAKYVLPPLDDMDELYTLPIFLVPQTTQEPIDCRFVSDTDACVALNQQRHKESAIRYTTAAPNPMQIKIEILAALSKGKPLLVFLMSVDKRVSAIGRNTMAAIDMLEPEKKALVKVMVHGWGFYEAPFLLKAIKCAQEGETIDEAYEACKKLGDHNFSFSNFVTSATVSKLLAWRPGLFPKGFSVEDNSFIGFGIPTTIREKVPTEFQRVGQLMNFQSSANTMSELQDAEIARIKKNLKPDEKIRAILVQTVGRPDYGHQYVKKMKEANVPMTDDVVATVYNGSFFSVALSAWGEMSTQYIVEKDT